MAKLATVRQAAESLAVSRSMIRKMLNEGALTRVRVGRCVRVRVAEIEALIESPAAAVVKIEQRVAMQPESTIIDAGSAPSDICDDEITSRNP